MQSSIGEPSLALYLKNNLDCSHIFSTISFAGVVLFIENANLLFCSTLNADPYLFWSNSKGPCNSLATKSLIIEAGFSARF